MGSLLFSYYIYIFMFYVRYIHVMLYGSVVVYVYIRHPVHRYTRLAYLP
jgi:hypothetical protein